MDPSILDYVKKVTEDLLSYFGLNTSVEVHADEDDDVVSVSVPTSMMNGYLIGNRGDTLHAFQSLISSMVRAKDMNVRINLDIANYKHSRQEKLANKAREWMEQVKASGEAMPLRPMNAADRRVIHKLADDYQLTTESVGEGRERHIVINSVSTDATRTKDD